MLELANHCLMIRPTLLRREPYMYMYIQDTLLTQITNYREPEYLYLQADIDCYIYLFPHLYRFSSNLYSGCPVFESQCWNADISCRPQNDLLNPTM